MTPAITRWAHLKLIGQPRKPLMAMGPNNVPYVADTWGPVYLRLLCDCGHEFEIPQLEFPGRRKLRSCGREECPFSRPQKPVKRFRERGSAFSVYLGADMAQRTQDYAREHHLSFSGVVEAALRDFFLRKLLE